MSDQPSWNPPYRPGPSFADSSLEDSQSSYVFPQPGIPSQAPGIASAPGHHQPPSPGYPSTLTDGISGPSPFPTIFAATSTNLGGFPMQPKPMTSFGNENYGTSWSHHATNTLSQWNAPHSVPVAPHEPLSPGETYVEAPHSSDKQCCAPRSTSISWGWHEIISIFMSQDTMTCWGCKSSQKKCTRGATPCDRCRTSKINCRRGPICGIAGLGMFCPLPPQDPQTSSRPRLPPELVSASYFVDRSRRRWRDAIVSIKASHLGGQARREQTHSDILVRVVTTEVENIRSYDQFEGTGFLVPLELPYDDFISKIVWEVENASDVAYLIGIVSVEDLVGFLEAASLCESRFGHYKKERRLVFNSMRCLNHCIEVLRLSSEGLLIPDPHSHCGPANECVSPGVRSLSKYASQYAEALDKEIFHKDKRKSSNWLLIFYSLCIQSHVRRALMLLEGRRNWLLGPSAASSVEVPAASYLIDAVFLFREISMQNKGRLLAKIRNSRAQPSVYLQQQHHPTRADSNKSNPNSWEKWHSEGVIEYLDRMFDISSERNPANPARPIMHHQVSHPSIHQTEAPASDGADSDSEGTISAGSPIVTSATTTAGTPTAIPATAQITVASNSTGANTSNPNDIEMDYCPPIVFPPSERETATPVPSVWTMTSTGQDSTAPSFFGSEWASFNFSPTTSYAGSMTPSMQSVSTVMLDDLDIGTFQLDDMAFDGAGFDFNAWRESNDQ